MPKNDAVSLTYFLDFVQKSGTPKLTVVRKYKNRPEYDPAADYYKQLRDRIVRMHQRDEPKGVLDDLTTTVNAKKRAHYAQAIAGYKRFLGKRTVTWFEAPKAKWSGGIEVSVNPEVGLNIDGTDFVLKLYFKDDRLATNRVEMVNHLLAEALADPKAQRRYGVVDMRSGRLISTPPDPMLDALLRGEAAAFAAMLPLV